MRKKSPFEWLVLAGFVFPVPAMAQTPSVAYPAKTVRMVTAEAGGSSDIASRLIAQGIAGPLGQPVIVENRPGLIAIETVAKAPADGYTMLYYGGVVWIEPLLRDNAPWDALRDFAPVTWAVYAPNILVVHPSLPVKSVKELIALARARPGDLNYAAAGTGSSSHLAGELFNVMAKVKVVRIPYKGTTAAFNDIIAGQVQIMFASAVGASAYIKAGRLKALAITSQRPSALYPALPTVAASGLPEYESGSITGVLVPVKTPGAIVARLNAEIVKYMNQPDVREKFAGFGVDVVAGTPEQFTSAIRGEIDRLGKVIKAAGIKSN